jgi:hypothetical protein
LIHIKVQVYPYYKNILNRRGCFISLFYIYNVFPYFSSHFLYPNLPLLSSKW